MTWLGPKSQQDLGSHPHPLQQSPRPRVLSACSPESDWFVCGQKRGLGSNLSQSTDLVCSRDIPIEAWGSKNCTSAFLSNQTSGYILREIFFWTFLWKNKIADAAAASCSRSGAWDVSAVEDCGKSSILVIDCSISEANVKKLDSSFYQRRHGTVGCNSLSVWGWKTELKILFVIPVAYFFLLLYCS